MSFVYSGSLVSGGPFFCGCFRCWTPNRIASSKLDLPLVLVCFAPFELTLREGLATNNDLEALILIICAARNFLIVSFGEVALCDWRPAFQPGRAHSRSQSKDKGDHKVGGAHCSAVLQYTSMWAGE